MSEIEMRVDGRPKERTPAEVAASDVREAVVRYVRSAGLAGVVDLEAELGSFTARALDELVAEGVFVASGERGRDYRLSCPELARILAEYTYDFLEGSSGPDVDALSDRLAEILDGKPPTKPWNPTTTETKVSTSVLDEAVEKAALLSFPATRANYAQLAAWLRELQQRRADEARMRGPQGHVPDPNPTATAISRLIRTCFCPPDFDDLKATLAWKKQIHAEAIRIYRETDREACDMWGELVALLDFVHSEVLKEAIPRALGGQPKPSA